LVLIVLAVIWVVVLVPPALRARAEGRPGDSISAFRRQLAVLQRARPRASRFAGLGAGRGARAGLHGPVTVASWSRTADAAGRVALGSPMARPSVPPVGVRRSTQKRRRDVFTGLLAMMVATLALGFVPTLHWLWAVHLLTDALFAAYVAMLIRLRNLAAEREMKVRFLPSTPTLEPLLLRRSAN
jgi:hypothetical protein